MTKKPPKKPQPGAKARRVRMAAAKVAGQTTSAIARTEGIERHFAARELASAECQQVIVQLVREHASEIDKLWTDLLTVVKDAFGADKVVMANGQPLNLGADHFARLTAANVLLKMITAGRPTPQPPESAATRKTVTLEELEQLLSGSSKEVLQ